MHRSTESDKKMMKSEGRLWPSYHREVMGAYIRTVVEEVGTRKQDNDNDQKKMMSSFFKRLGQQGQETHFF